MKRGLDCNPWIGILIKPRKTIRALIQYNTSYRFIIFCAIFGFLNSLQAAQYISMGLAYPVWITIFFSAILSIPIGYIFFNTWAFFILILGKLLKGKGTFKEIRAAYYWPEVTSLVSIGIWLGQVYLFGSDIFVSEYTKTLTGNLLLVNLFLSIFQAIAVVWGFIIFLHALGEVQGFSSWMALLNTILALFTKVVFVILIAWGVSALMQIS